MKLSQLTQVLLTSALLAACGGAGSKEPLKDYPDLKQDVVPHQQAVRDQSFDVCLSDIVTRPMWIAVEGKSMTQEIFVRGTQALMVEDLALKAAPAEMKIQKVGMTDRGLKFSVSYPSPLSNVPAGQNFLESEIEITPISRAKNFVPCPKTVGFVITRTNKVPVISKVSAPKSMDFDATESAFVDVTIRAENLALPENLEIVEGFDFAATSKENPVLNFKSAIRQVSEVTRVSGSTYRVRYEILPELIRFLLRDPVKQAPQKSEFEMLVRFNAFNSEANLKSPSVNLVLKVLRNIPTPKSSKTGSTK